MSLSNDALFPQYLVLFYLRDESGAFVEFLPPAVFATRSAALSFIRLRRHSLETSIRSDAFDSYSDSLSPAFRLYHVTRTKI